MSQRVPCPFCSGTMHPFEETCGGPLCQEARSLTLKMWTISAGTNPDDPKWGELLSQLRAVKQRIGAKDRR